MPGLRGDPTSLNRLAASLRRAPLTLAANVAKRAAPALTQATQAAYSAGRTVDGSARPAAVDGGRLTLKDTGAAQRSLRFVSIGTQARCVLGTPYLPYLIGRYGVLPSGKQLPTAWRAELARIVSTSDAGVGS